MLHCCLSKTIFLQSVNWGMYKLFVALAVLPFSHLLSCFLSQELVFFIWCLSVLIAFHLCSFPFSSFRNNIQKMSVQVLKVGQTLLPCLDQCPSKTAIALFSEVLLEGIGISAQTTSVSIFLYWQFLPFLLVKFTWRLQNVSIPKPKKSARPLFLSLLFNNSLWRSPPT